MKRIINRTVLATVTGFMTANAAYALPEVSNVMMTQRENSRIVDITYDLSGEAAIVTLGIETNGVAIPDSAVTRLSGDVSVVVQPDTGKKSMTWNVGADWPENVAGSAKPQVTAWSTNAPPQVMVIDLSKGTAATDIDPYPVYYYTSLDALPSGGLSNAIYQTSRLVMNKIPSGDYEMGNETSLGASVTVTLTKDFYAGVYLVTQKQWSKVMGSNPSTFKKSSHPVEYVRYLEIREGPATTVTVMDPNWPESDAVHADSFMGRLRTKTGLAGFDLPTEAQWEYACRAGTTTYYNDGVEGSSTNQLNQLGWWKGNSEGSTHPVGQKKPNAWGLYDMHGNVNEWCLDFYVSSLAGGEDPKGGETGLVHRVVRGGSWNKTQSACRSIYRTAHSPTDRTALGFRLVRTLP